MRRVGLRRVRGAGGRQVVRLAGLIVALLTLAFGTSAVAQARTLVFVSPVREDPAIAGRLPPSYSRDALRRELEVALENTGVFSVAAGDDRDLYPVLDQYKRSHRRPPAGVRLAEYVLNPVLEAFSVAERRRPAPMTRGYESVSTAGLIALTVEVVAVADGSVRSRIQIDAPYRSAERLADPLPGDDLDRGAGTSAPASAEQLRLAYQEVGRAFAKRILDQISPAVVAQRTGDTIYISRGEDAGYVVGQSLRIIHRGAPVRHPVTHEVIGYDEQTVGEAEVVEALPKMTVARIVRGPSGAAVGDVVREPPPPPRPRDDD